MILSSDLILDRIRKGELQFTPEIDQFQMQMHAVDLRLGFTFLIPKAWEMSDEGRVAVVTDHLNPSHDRKKFTSIELTEGQVFDILPGEFIAVTTLETVKLPRDLMGILYPRSSVNRRGLSVDLTGIVDAGYEGKLLIPVRNNTLFQVIRMYPGERFCQLVFEEIAGTPTYMESRWHKTDITVTLKDERDNQEMEYVRKGKIKQLKQDYRLLNGL